MPWSPEHPLMPSPTLQRIMLACLGGCRAPVRRSAQMGAACATLCVLWNVKTEVGSAEERAGSLMQVTGFCFTFWSIFLFPRLSFVRTTTKGQITFLMYSPPFAPHPLCGRRLWCHFLIQGTLTKSQRGYKILVSH